MEMKITVELTHGQVVTLMRAMTRSLEQTPDLEVREHALMYAKLSDWCIKTTDPETIKVVGEALDRVSGR